MYNDKISFRMLPLSFFFFLSFPAWKEGPEVVS